MLTVVTLVTIFIFFSTAGPRLVGDNCTIWCRNEGDGRRTYVCGGDGQWHPNGEASPLDCKGVLNVETKIGFIGKKIETDVPRGTKNVTFDPLGVWDADEVHYGIDHYRLTGDLTANRALVGKCLEKPSAENGELGNN